MSVIMPEIEVIDMTDFSLDDEPCCEVGNDAHSGESPKAEFRGRVVHSCGCANYVLLLCRQCKEIIVLSQLSVSCVYCGDSLGMYRDVIRDITPL